MEISNSPLEFTSEDISIWRQFLRTQTGARLIPKLLESSPVLLERGDSNEILIRTGAVKGFQEAARTLLAMAFPLPETPKPVTEYPSPEDDAAWNDGKTLNTKK
jgi:hypothetical protein